MSKYHDWRACHSGKYIFVSKWHAWRVITQIWLREKHVDTLRPYVCRWTYDYSAGRIGAPHIHIGHKKKYWTISQRMTRRWKKLTIYPYFRTRSRYRRFRKRLAGLQG